MTTRKETKKLLSFTFLLLFSSTVVFLITTLEGLDGATVSVPTVPSKVGYPSPSDISQGMNTTATTPALTSTTAISHQSWAKCRSSPLAGSFLLLGGCRAKTMGGKTVIAPVYNTSVDFDHIVASCDCGGGGARVANFAEAVEMAADGSKYPSIVDPPELTFMENRVFNHQPYRNTIFPSGAFQFYSTHMAVRGILTSMNLPLPVHVTDWPTAVNSVWGYTLPIAKTKYAEYALSVGKNPGRILMNSSRTSSSIYHCIGLWRKFGLHGWEDGLTYPIDPEAASEFKSFREMLVNRSLEDYGEVKPNLTAPVMYGPRTEVCDPERFRVRFIPSSTAVAMGNLFLNETNGTFVAVEDMIGPMSAYQQHLYNIRSRKIIFAAEGAMFTWMLVGHPDTIWVIHNRALTMTHRAHTFFGAFVRIFPNIKLVVYVVSNGVEPPLEDLRRAVSEPFEPHVIKFVGANSEGYAQDNGQLDPILRKCMGPSFARNKKKRRFRKKMPERDMGPVGVVLIVPTGRVSFRSAHGTHLQGNGGQVCTSANMGAWETWTVDTGGFEVVLRSHDGQYLRADPLGVVDTSPSTSEWETWTIQAHPSEHGKYTIRSHHKTYLRADAGTNRTDLAKSAGVWEAWELIYARPSSPLGG